LFSEKHAIIADICIVKNRAKYVTFVMMIYSYFTLIGMCFPFPLLMNRMNVNFTSVDKDLGIAYIVVVCFKNYLIFSVHPV